MREAAHYTETIGLGQTHRNSEIRSCLETIEYITKRGGWVVRLGGPGSPALPRLKQVVDYAHGKFKSPIMDLRLIRDARAFIGTTSGLTNVAVSLGVPCALVNCISTDAQLWGSRVRFAPKPVRLRNGRMLSQREITSTPWRWRMFTAETLLHHGAFALENTPDEILETYKEVESLSVEAVKRDPPDGADILLIEKWRESLEIPHFYGNAVPSLHFLRKYAVEFLPEAQRGRAVGPDMATALKLMVDSEVSNTAQSMKYCVR
jgi:putative glycosyltransferase (TIGR04372 family)